MKALGWVLALELLVSLGWADAASSPTEDYLVPGPTAGWINGTDGRDNWSTYGGKGFHIEVDRSNALVGSPVPGSGTTVSFRVLVTEFDHNVVPALDRIQFVSPCGPSAEKNPDGTVLFSRMDETHFEYQGGIFTTLPGQKYVDPLLLPKGTYLFHLYLSADAARIQECTLRLSGVFGDQDKEAIPDLSFGRARISKPPLRPVP